jgi:hypothetical protein
MYPIATMTGAGTSALFMLPHGMGGPQTILALGDFDGCTLTLNVTDSLGTILVPLPDIAGSAISLTDSGLAFTNSLSPGIYLQCVLAGEGTPSVTVYGGGPIN